MSNFTLECCVDSFESAKIAQDSGATRLELCSNIIIGGTTPSLNLLKEIKANLHIPVNVLIRPRFGDFLYSQQEFELICKDIQDCIHFGADGIVFGCLNSDGTLDTIRMKKVRELCKHCTLTLHRAFDVCKDAYLAMKECEEIGINTILTSGQKNTCTDGLILIKDLFSKSINVDILVGGGVTADTISCILSQVPINNFHMTGKKTLESKMQYRNTNVSMGLDGISEYTKFLADEKKIKDASNVLKQYFSK